MGNWWSNVKPKIIFWLARHFAMTSSLLRFSLGLVRFKTGLKKVRPLRHSTHYHYQQKALVYWPSCHSQLASLESVSVARAIKVLASAAGFEILVPSPARNLCCGRVFEYINEPRSQALVARQLSLSLQTASSYARIPCFTDSILCSQYVNRTNKPVSKNLTNQDNQPVFNGLEFICEYILPHLSLTLKEPSVQLLVPASLNPDIYLSLFNDINQEIDVVYSLQQADSKRTLLVLDGSQLVNQLSVTSKYKFTHIYAWLCRQAELIN